jgi:ubiquinone/menaquinone biosynthesis C-methylase UbiE
MSTSDDSSGSHINHTEFLKNLLRADYEKKEYWEKRYTELETDQTFEWYFRWETIKPFLLPFLSSTTLNILHVGCGNSELGEGIWKDGFGDVTNIDCCENVIAHMKERLSNVYSAKSPPSSKQCKYLVMDATKMDFEDETFDFILEKGMLDTFVCGDDEPVWNYLRECYRYGLR